MSDRISWQVTVTTKGTPVQGPDSGPGDFMIRRHPANTGTYIYVGNNGADHVTSTDGMVSGTGDAIVITVKTLKEVWFDADANGDKVTIFRVFGGHI